MVNWGPWGSGRESGVKRIHDNILQAPWNLHKGKLAVTSGRLNSPKCGMQGVVVAPRMGNTLGEG